MRARSGKVVVVGGGLIGAASAYYLNRSGWDVTLLDRGGFGAGCSHANCGFVSPSHVLPLAAPGAATDALKTLFARNSPLKIRLRFDPALWGWLFRFARRCNPRDMLEAGRAISALLNSSRSLYEEILRDEGIDCEWEARGMLFVFRTATALDHYAETDRLMHSHFGVGARRVGGDELTAMEPALKPGLGGAYYYDTDAHLRPDRLMAGWKAALLRLGVLIHEDCPVEGVVRDRRLARAVVTPRGTFEAEAFVFATGAWTPLLARQIGCSVPIQPGKGYSITMARPALCPTYPLIFEEHRVAVTPMRSGYRLGSTMEFAGYDATLNHSRLELLREGARHYLHEPYCEPVEEEWFGWRPMTYDGKPVIGPSPAASNLIIAAGHNMLGLSMAPATGKLVAELLDGKTPHIDPAPYSANRFEVK